MDLHGNAALSSSGRHYARRVGEQGWTLTASAEPPLSVTGQSKLTFDRSAGLRS
jgi:hypothetical protein